MKSGKTSVAAIASASSVPGAFRENLEKAWRELDPDGELFAIAGGALPGETVFEMRMPKLSGDDLVSAIEFELPRQMPCPAEDVAWGFRSVGEIEGARDIAVRIWAVPNFLLIGGLWLICRVERGFSNAIDRQPDGWKNGEKAVLKQPKAVPIELTDRLLTRAFVRAIIYRVSKRVEIWQGDRSAAAI